MRSVFHGEVCGGGASVSRWPADYRVELEAFWRSHLEGWRRSELNQREYCEAHGLPLKRFGNWRGEWKQEEEGPGKVGERGSGGAVPNAEKGKPIGQPGWV